MAMSNPIKDALGTRPNLTKSRFRGYVVDRDDPKKRQRVKIRIPQLHRGISDEDLPWSRPSNGGVSNAGSGVGAVNIPPVGALVEGFFEEDDPHNFVFSGSPTVDSVNKDNELLKEDYPYTHGEIDESGNRFSINKLRNEILWQHKSGASIFIDGNGAINLTAKAGVNISGKGINLASSSGIVAHGSSEVNIKGGDVRLNGGGSKISAANPSARPKPSIPSPKGKTSM